ncbi:ABC transporter substrate-binding protein [Limobrevibacterium gyesilva]|uniref:ABC transporter substrate-binding protein n=1 Tax=Limobrevibacterium gyesilva TaxID=2991712 RepID=A0AA41YU19_9PROT|nr:ABC transporter substrate-binding protein [Limobrevibacterium gyesilva]MCW3475422.1 ABC transporter substrate-binding protein [Limobrevibacterium gyesilva]
MRTIIGLTMAALLAGTTAHAADITVGIAAAPSSADPHFHQVGPNNALARDLFGALVRTDPQLRPQPDLATAWTLLDDRSWKITLRPGVTFHDGSPFTANDVVFSLCRARSGVGPTKSFTNLPKALDRVDVADDHTIVLHTHRPEPGLLDLLAGFAIISARSAGAGTVTFSDAENCGLTALPASNEFDGGRMANGTGPYRLAKYTSGDTIVLEANATYSGPKPHWSRVILKPVPKTGPRVAGLLSGDFDLIENPSSQDLPVLKAKGGLAWTVTPSDRIMFLQPDIGRPQTPLITTKDGRNPLQDVRVRQALSLAIDRKTIATRLMDGLAVPADQYVTPGMFSSLATPPARDYDPARARALLAEAGYPDGFALTLSATNDRYINDAQVAQAIGQYLTRIGIRTTVDAMTQTMFFPRRAKREFSLGLGGWGNGTGEATLLRYFVVSPFPDRGIGTSNYGRYHSDAFDAAFLPALEDMNEASRRAHLEKATTIALQDHALIPLYWETTVWAFKDRYTYVGRVDQATDPDGLSLK